MEISKSENNNLSEDLGSSSEQVRIRFFCRYCQKFHSLKLAQDLFASGKFPVTYAYIHGDPMVIATLFIDANYKVRGVEYMNEFGVSQDQLSHIMAKSKSLTLTSIPTDLIYAFQLLEDKKIQKIYMKDEFNKKINFNEIFKIWKLSEKIAKKDQTLNEFFLKYGEFWVSGLEFADYKFILVVDASVDIDHLKTQMMGLFETMLS